MSMLAELFFLPQQSKKRHRRLPKRFKEKSVTEKSKKTNFKKNVSFKKIKQEKRCQVCY